MFDHRSKPVFKKKNLKERATYSDIIYQDIKKAILDGRIIPTQKLTIRGICSMFNVSMSPVREAIQRLSAEKYLSVVKSGEIRVIDLSQKDVENILGLILAIDIYTLKDTITSIPEKEIAQLKIMNQKLGEYYDKNSVDEYVKLSIDIHREIWGNYDNELIVETLNNALDKMISLAPNYIANYTPEVLKKSWDDHSRLINALEKRDFKMAEEVLSRHWSAKLHEK